MPSRSGATARQVWWASVPVWSIGFLSPVPFLIYAIIHRTRRDWAVFAGYLAATVAMVVALGAAGSDDAATAGAAQGGAAPCRHQSRSGQGPEDRAADLPREYDDGGLVDVNQVPVGVFSSALGLTPIEARDVLAARDKLGRFVSAEELCEYTQSPPTA